MRNKWLLITLDYVLEGSIERKQATCLFDVEDVESGFSYPTRSSSLKSVNDETTSMVSKIPNGGSNYHLNGLEDGDDGGNSSIVNNETGVQTTAKYSNSSVLDVLCCLHCSLYVKLYCTIYHLVRLPIAHDVWKLVSYGILYKEERSQPSEQKCTSQTVSDTKILLQYIVVKACYYAVYKRLG